MKSAWMETPLELMTVIKDSVGNIGVQLISLVPLVESGILPPMALDPGQRKGMLLVKEHRFPSRTLRWT